MKKIFSLFVAALFSASMFAATETTVYYTAPEATIGTYTVKLNTNQQTNPDSWHTYVMSKTELNYNGDPVYRAQFTDLWDGVATMQIQLYDGETWKSQVVPVSSWTSAATYNGKMWVHGSSEWVEAPAGDIPDVTLYFVNAEEWTDVHAFVFHKEGTDPAVEYKAYPGEAMIKTDMKLKGKDVYSYTFPETYDKIGFVEVGGTHETNNYSWNTLTPYYYEDGDGVASNNWHAITDLYENVTAYFVNDDDWTVVNAFVWPDAGSAYKAWPGEAMTKTAEQVNGKDIYSYTFPENYVNIIFNNKVGDEGTQTVDLKFDVAKPYYSRAQGKWYATKGDIPAVVVPAKFYITGTAVGGWDPAAVKSTEDSYTITGLAADTEYKLKVTVDGTWGTAKGYSDLTVKAAGLSEGDNNNIVFKLASDGDVVVTYTSTVFKLEGDFKAEATALDNAQAGEKAMKMIENGQLVILKNGVRYSVLGVRVK